ncbi:MAG: redoxin domain-containing protein [Rikenellaceae bacterium]
MANKISTYIIAILALCGCNSSKVTIEGRFIGSESSMVYLERVESFEPKVIDSAKLDDEGRFTISFDAVEDTPSLYNITNGGEQIPLFLGKGEQIKISTMGSVARSYRVEGSKESELLRQFYQPYIKGISSLDAIATEYASVELSTEERKEWARKYGAEYQTLKQTQLQFIIKNQSSLAAVYALFQRLPGDQYLFNGDNDVIYLRTVADALEENYPSSTYLKALRNKIKTMEENMSSKTKIHASNFPELEINDMYGKKVKLSSLLGKVILLEFWSAELGNSNARNAELKELYTEFKDQGFEIYQVGVDSSKSLWISTVQEQRLPWISVSDLKGGASPVLGIYNVTKLPTNFLIARDGTVVARDVDQEELHRQIPELIK